MRPTLNILSDDLIEQILSEAKRILAEVGMEVRGRELRQRLVQHGLPLKNDRIHFPPEVVDWAIQQAPQAFTLYTRDGRPHEDRLVVEGRHLERLREGSADLLDLRADAVHDREG